MTNPLVLWPVRFTGSKVLRVTVDGTTENLTCGVTAGRDYWLTDDGTADSAAGNGDLVALLETWLETHSKTPAFTVALSASTFKITISCNLDFSILWKNASTTLDAGIFGFDVVDSPAPAAATDTGAYIAKGIWRPERPVSIDSRERQPVVGGVARSISGLQRVSRLGLPVKTRQLGWTRLPQAKALTEYVAVSEPTGSWEYAWIYAASLGYRLRYYVDESTITAGTGYSTYVAATQQDTLSRDQAWPQRWNLTLDLAGSS